MSNPLKEYFEVSDRDDGVYVRVDPLKPVPAIDELKEKIGKELVINCDFAILKGIMERKNGEFEKLGPHFEYYQPKLDHHIQLASSPLKVVIKIDPQCILDLSLTVNQLRNFLFLKGICFGVDEDMLEKIVEEKIFGQDVEVAQAKMPVRGEDALIDFVVDVNPQLKPEIKNDGSVDYRNVRAFTPVSDGQILVKKTMATAGKDGISVTGEPIPAEPGSDKPLPKGRNTEVSEDGTELLSLKNGIVCEENGLVCVKEILAIHGNVDFSVGNIKHSGDVQINGDVLPGFSVEANGDITIKGEIESARIISREGSVFIDKGVIGRGDTLISALSGIHVSFAQNATLKTNGKISIAKYALHCECICDSFEGAQCSIIGGSVKAEKSISAKQAGSEKEVKTKLVLYDKIKEENLEKIRQIEELESKLVKQLEPVEINLKSKAVILKKSGKNVSDYQRKEVRKWVDAYNKLTLKIKYVREKLEEIKSETKDWVEYNGFVYIAGQIFPGVKIDVFGKSIPQKPPMSNKKIRIDAGEINTEGKKLHD
ncbi:Serine phosphatase RsbU, regulator of sigma subunit [Chitinispirillum alkaliphilum]|nr:Serine phosphatase RsbU, regulator of sigma subunit [Chitinispirillum alkaliphilum]